MIPLSILDLSPVPEGSHAGQALRNTRDLAQHAERWGYNRYWLAEHHNMMGIASAATAVVIGYVADATSTIRVGAGGVMLPNHAPLVIAEQFGTLEALFPGRIDLGLGRAPGSDGLTAQALRRDLTTADTFPQDVLEVQHYFRLPEPGQPVQAVPGAGLDVPLWILGSSLFGAQVAAALGLPYAFASHFAPAQLRPAVEIYRKQFRPSAQLAEPYVMLGLNIVAAETDAEARRLFTSVQQQFVNLRRGRPGKLQPPIADPAYVWPAPEQFILDQALGEAVVGSPETVRHGLERFILAHRPDEVMVTAQIYDHALRLRSYQTLAGIRDAMALGEKRATAAAS